MSFLNKTDIIRQEKGKGFMAISVFEDIVPKEKKSKEWLEGYLAGQNDMRSELGDMTRDLLRFVSDCYVNRRYENNEILSRLSRIYACIYGSVDMFDYQYFINRRRMTEPEIRFQRLATEEEYKSTFSELTEKWSK